MPLEQDHALPMSLCVPDYGMLIPYKRAGLVEAPQDFRTAESCMVYTEVDRDDVASNFQHAEQPIAHRHLDMIHSNSRWRFS